MPHNSSKIPISLAKRLNPEAQLSKDTDWFIDKLYDFAHDLGVHTLTPAFSRYYIDLNRDPSGRDLYPGADNTELCPTTNFNNQELYLDGLLPDETEIEKRLETAWHPYHQYIAKVLGEMVDEHGYALLFDAHSIASEVPRFFEGKLLDFNFGNAGGKSCSTSIFESIGKINFLPFSAIYNGRFKGGYITRCYGDPANNIQALQLELSQATYLDEKTLEWDPVKAVKVKIHLQKIIQSLLDWKHA